jgi:endonuclease-8
MPEGDTIFRTATTLRAVLAGKPLTGFRATRVVGRPPDPGTPIGSVEARGKHLLIHFGDGRVLHSHLGMSGSWWIARPDEPWPKPSSRARAVIEVEGAVAICFSPPTLELLRQDQLRFHPVLSALGPDLCDPNADLDEALRRLRQLDPSTEVGTALLDQRAASGVGNVYKSEVLHARSVNPFLRIADLEDPVLLELLGTASELLRRNLQGYPRRTTETGLAVYGLAGKPCPRCGTPIAFRRQGEQARATYWCPSCQTSER